VSVSSSVPGNGTLRGVPGSREPGTFLKNHLYALLNMLKELDIFFLSFCGKSVSVPDSLERNPERVPGSRKWNPVPGSQERRTLIKYLFPAFWTRVL